MLIKRSLYRALAFTQHFFVAIINLGIVGSIRAHLIYRKRATEKPIYVWLKPMRRRFYFRGASDRGVLSHYFYPGYHINDAASSNKVHYIIDAGANIGDETLRFRFFHPDAKIFALEAEPRNFEILKLNTAGDPNIVTLNVGLWSESCKLEILPAINNESFQVRKSTPNSKNTKIDAISMVELMEQFDIPQIDILKLDIEGAEKTLFAGDLSGWIPRLKVLIFEPPDREAHSRVCRS